LADEREELIATLSDLEAVLIRSVNIAAKRSPEAFIEEAKALYLIIQLKRELRD